MEVKYKYYQSYIESKRWFNTKLNLKQKLYLKSIFLDYWNQELLSRYKISEGDYRLFNYYFNKFIMNQFLNYDSRLEIQNYRTNSDSEDSDIY